MASILWFVASLFAGVLTTRRLGRPRLDSRLKRAGMTDGLLSFPLFEKEGRGEISCHVTLNVDVTSCLPPFSFSSSS
jgi:hypothetical protein